MGTTRRFSGGQGLHSPVRGGAADGKKILRFDPSRRITAKHVPLTPKRQHRPTAPKTTILGAIRSAIAFLLKTSRGLRSRARGAEPSGKRRA